MNTNQLANEIADDLETWAGIRIDKFGRLAIEAKIKQHLERQQPAAESER